MDQVLSLKGSGRDSLRKKVARRYLYISEVKTIANNTLNNIIDRIAQQTTPPCLDIPVSCWDLLRDAFEECLEVYEMQRRCSGATSLSMAEDAGFQDMLLAMLDAEFAFGGVTAEELIGLVRNVYPEEAQQLLPRTAMDMWQEYNSPLNQYIRSLDTHLCSDEWQTLRQSAYTESIGSKADRALSDSKPSTGDMPCGTSAFSCASWSPNQSLPDLPFNDLMN